MAWLGTIGVGAAFGAAHIIPITLGPIGDTRLDLWWTAFMVRTFSFHAIAAVLLAGIAATVLRAPRLAMIAIVLGLAAGLSSGLSPLPGRSATGSGAAVGVRVLTINLWRGLRDLSAVLEEIDRTDPDLILLQEYTPLHDRALREALTHRYPWIEADPQLDFSGQATYARLPMHRVSSRLLGPRAVLPTEPVHWERQLCCIVEVGGREIVVQNIHLPTAPMGRGLMQRHLSMVGEIRDWLATEQRPCIVAGDFNCTPMSAEAGVLRRTGLIDAHRAAGSGLGTTWGQRLAWPGFRIDHIYARGLRPIECHVGADVGSDHRPVFAELRFE